MTLYFGFDYFSSKKSKMAAKIAREFFKMEHFPLEMLKIPSSARFLCSFSNFLFGEPLGSIKYENLGGQFF